MQTSERDDRCLLLYYISRMGFSIYHILSYGTSIKKTYSKRTECIMNFQLSDTINDQKECLSCNKKKVNPPAATILQNF